MKDEGRGGGEEEEATGEGTGDPESSLDFYIARLLREG